MNIEVAETPRKQPYNEQKLRGGAPNDTPDLVASALPIFSPLDNPSSDNGAILISCLCHRFL